MTTHAQRNIESQIDAEVPLAMYWSCDQVAYWVESLGFPLYRDCFLENNVSGRKLLFVGASQLPEMGIQDFNHIKVITSAIRDVLSHRMTPDYTRSISLPQTEDAMGLFLEIKTRTGQRIDGLSYSHFIKSQAKLLKRLYGEKAPTVPRAYERH